MSVEYLNKFFRFTYLNDEGVSTTEYLEDEPINWDKVPILLKRDMLYHGVNYQFTDGDIMLEFDELSGVDVINQVYERDGQDGSVIMEYGSINPDTTKAVEYTGKLNLNTYKILNERVTCSIENAGFHELLNSRDDTNINIFDSKTLDGRSKTWKNPVNLTLHSKKLQKVCLVKGEVYDYFELTTDINQDDEAYFTLHFMNPEPGDIAEFYGNQVNIWADNPLPSQLDNFPVMKLSEAGNYHFFFDLYFRMQLIQIQNSLFGESPEIESVSMRVMLYVYGNGATVPKQSIIIYDTGVVPQPYPGSRGYFKTYHVGNEFQIDNLLVNDSIYILGEIHLDGAGDWTGLKTTISTENPWPAQVTIMKITALTVQPATQAKGMLIYETLQSIVESITNQSGIVKSEIFGRIDNGYTFKGKYSEYGISNGFFIRNFNILNRALNTTFNKTIVSLKAIFNVGIGYEYFGGILKIVFEDIAHFFQDNEIIRIIDYSDYSEEVAKEFIYNEGEIGYSKFPEEGSYLLDEFNTKINIATPIQTNKAKFQAVSDFIASGYAIEETRRVQFASNPADSTTYDDENFIIALKKDGTVWKSLKNEGFETDNILDGSTAYNLPITPMRNLLRHARWINGGLVYKKDTDLIKNTLFKMNGAAKTKATGEADFIQENADVALLNFDARKHFANPKWVNLKCRLNMDQIITIKNAFNGLDVTRQNGYISIARPGKPDTQIWLYEMGFIAHTEQVTLKGLKKDLDTTDLTCDDFKHWTFKDFESTPVPSWVEDCIFSDFD